MNDRAKSLGAALAALCIVIVGCEKATGPTPGAVVVSLTSPALDDGAVLVSLTGAVFQNVAPAASGYVVYSRLTAADELKVVVIGNVGAGPLFTAQVSDTRSVGSMRATVLDVASRADSTRASLAGYSATVAAGSSP